MHHSTGCRKRRCSSPTQLPALLLGASALLAAARRRSAAAAVRTVLVQPAEARDAGGVYTGEIRARHEVDLAFRVGGKIAARLVDTGAEVKAGQPLARLDPNDLQLAGRLPAPRWLPPRAT
jgi:multidrug efflux system membrane fusion protein